MFEIPLLFGDYMELCDMHIHLEQGPYTVSYAEQFVEQAERMNLTEINLLEHSVRFKEFHNTFKEAGEYSAYQNKWLQNKIKTAGSLDDFKKLACDIRSRNYSVKVSFGLEICWFEQHGNYISSLVDDDFFDYIIGSVHWVDNWTFNQRKYQWLNKDVNNIYKRYFEMEKSLIESNIFNAIAHPDLIMCHGLYPDYDLTKTYDELCRAAAFNKVKIEMNSARGRKQGINNSFFEAAIRNNVSFITGSDAHCVEDVGKGIEKMTKLISHRSMSAGL